jgi:hypothetical protein
MAADARLRHFLSRRERLVQRAMARRRRLSLAPLLYFFFPV